MMTLWQVYTNTRWQHVTACWDLMYQLVENFPGMYTQNRNPNRLINSTAVKQMCVNGHEKYVNLIVI